MQPWPLPKTQMRRRYSFFPMRDLLTRARPTFDRKDFSLLQTISTPFLAADLKRIYFQAILRPCHNSAWLVPLRQSVLGCRKERENALVYLNRLGPQI